MTLPVDVSKNKSYHQVMTLPVDVSINSTALSYHHPVMTLPVDASINNTVLSPTDNFTSGHWYKHHCLIIYYHPVMPLLVAVGIIKQHCTTIIL